jgi:hypothetical protein
MPLHPLCRLVSSSKVSCSSRLHLQHPVSDAVLFNRALSNLLDLLFVHGRVTAVVMARTTKNLGETNLGVDLLHPLEIGLGGSLGSEDDVLSLNLAVGYTIRSA